VEMDAARVKEMLAGRAEAVCAFLLPTGKRVRHEWQVGDVHGAAGQSLRVCLEGPKAGWWADFAEGPEYRGKNLLSLWMAVRAPGDFATAIREAKEWLGVREETSGWRRAGAAHGKPRPQESRGTEDGKPEAGTEREWEGYATGPVVEGGRVWKWLTEERKLSADGIREYGLEEGTWKDKTGRERICVVFVYRSAEGETISRKWRDIEDKSFQPVYPRGAKKILFGMEAVGKEQGDLFLTEGELDAVSLWCYGLPAVSVPFGAKWEGQSGDPNAEWMESCWEWLERFAEVYLCLDGDEPGEKAAESICRRLGRHRCLRVRFGQAGAEGAHEGRPYKDANEALVAGESQEQVQGWVVAGKSYDPPELRRAREFRQEIWDAFWPAGGVEPGEPLPWAMPFRLRDGEVTLWHGFAKHGKTVGLSHVLLDVASRKSGVRVCVASLEIPGARTLQNMMRQALGEQKPQSEREMDLALGWLDERIWIYDKLGGARTEEVLEVFEYAARRYGIKHFVLDSLMRLEDVQEEDYEGQKKLMLRLCGFAAELDVHVHLVAHSRKPDQRHPEEKYWPTKYMVSGSGHLVNQAHNVVCLWRNLEKEQELEEARILGDMEKEEAAREKPDAMLVVQAQRGGNGELPLKRLWFDQQESWQYRDERRGDVVRYVPEEGQAQGLPVPEGAPA
jgi:twinkle protein